MRPAVCPPYTTDTLLATTPHQLVRLCLFALFAGKASLVLTACDCTGDSSSYSLPLIIWIADVPDVGAISNVNGGRNGDYIQVTFTRKRVTGASEVNDFDLGTSCIPYYVIAAKGMHVCSSHTCHLLLINTLADFAPVR
jgi:hypothetical protein